MIHGCNNEQKQEVPAQTSSAPVEVKVHTLHKETYPLWIHFTGKTQAIDEVNVITRVNGELQAYHFQPGQNVHKGDLLFTIDKSEYQAVWDQKNAILQKDRASYALARANVTRYTPLVEEQLAPKEKLDELTATLKQLEATIKADEAALAKAKLDLAYCSIRASIDGQIGKPFILPGNIVKTGDILSQIVQSRRLYVNFNPSSHEIGLIRKYAKSDTPKVKASVQGERGLDITLEGEIDFIDNVTNASTGTVAMRAIVENPEGLIFPGSFVDISLFLGDYTVLAVHPDQIMLDQLGEYVYVIDSNNTLKSVHFKPLFANSDLAIVGTAFKEGNRILTDTINGLSDGSKVIPVETPNPVKVK